MKKLIIISLIAALSATGITAFAAPIPRESAPQGADENAIVLAENLISPILDEVVNGTGYGSASARANTKIRKAVMANQTGGYGYGILSAISQNAIRATMDMNLRADYYKAIEEKLKVLLADLIADIQNGKDYYTALDEAYTRIYQSVNPSYNPSVDCTGDFCYWDIPAVDNAELTVARKLLLEAAK